MNIAHRNAGENWIGIIQLGTNNSTRNRPESFRIKLRANEVKSTDVKREDGGNVMIEMEMVVKSDAEELDVVC